MGKLIAFIGPPGSGKTSVAMQTAIEVYLGSKSNKVVFISPDLAVPSLGLLFPNYAPDDLKSLGQLFDRTDISEVTLLENAVALQSMNDLLCFGYKTDDSKDKYPEPIPQKLTDLFSVLDRKIAYTFVDCSDDPTDAISDYAIRKANVLVRVIPADLKGMTWYAANKYLHNAQGREMLNVVNTTARDLYLPTEEICTKVQDVTAVLPYSRTLKQYLLEGRLPNRVHDRAFLHKLKPITKSII